MLRKLTTLILFCLLLSACGLRVVNTSPTQRPDASITPLPSPQRAATAIAATPFPTTSQMPTATRAAPQYQTIYQQDGFSIRQAFIGPNVIWRWDDFPMPPSRIQNTVQDLGLGRKMTCGQSTDTNTPCSQTVSLPGPNEYTLRLASVKGGTGLLMKNGKLLWTGTTNGADSYAILTSKPIGSELVFDYSKSNWGTKEKAIWVTTSILLTGEKTVTLISDAFAPNAIDGKLIYFKMKPEGDQLVFDGQGVGETYSDIFNLLCCWHGPQINIASDGKIIDFFARKAEGWYHVQAGYLAEEQLK